MGVTNKLRLVDVSVEKWSFILMYKLSFRGKVINIDEHVYVNIFIDSFVLK